MLLFPYRAQLVRFPFTMHTNIVASAFMNSTLLVYMISNGKGSSKCSLHVLPFNQSIQISCFVLVPGSPLVFPTILTGPHSLSASKLLLAFVSLFSITIYVSL